MQGNVGEQFNMQYGDFIVENGVNCDHGNQGCLQAITIRPYVPFMVYFFMGLARSPLLSKNQVCRPGLQNMCTVKQNKTKLSEE